jgi:hypothetical protein
MRLNPIPYRVFNHIIKGGSRIIKTVGCKLRERIIISEEDTFGEKHREVELAKAITTLTKSRSFVLLTCNEEGHTGVSAVEGRDIVAILFGLKKMAKNLILSLDKIGEKDE